MKYFKSILIIFISALWLSCSSYQSKFNQAEILSQSPGVTLENHSKTIVVNPPSTTDTAIIFYPGAYVSYESYLPLLVKCASKGIKCFCVEMPSDLAIFGISSADMYLQDYPEIKNWYLAGHSLGGAMASSYVAKHSDDLKGLILLAAYSTVDLTKSGLKVLSIFGSNDKVLSKQKYESNKKNLPADLEEHILEGGNHANFGSYGFQKGDGEATMEAEVQKNMTAEFIADFCK